ncbi:MAG TPA: hypothetical protein VHM20_05995 [Gammaproteobacteria bacterium]|nr:hypothetical protein [Gammaproteobacteria bacterium]
MRFITEFELEYPYTLDKPERYKSGMDHEIGKLIHDTFGWKSKGNAKRERFTLEIEAFPMDKWIEFKKRFFDALPDYDTVSRTRLINALSDLESVIDIQKLPG